MARLPLAPVLARPSLRSSLAFVFGSSWLQSYHGGVWEFAVLLMLIGAIALVAAPWIRRRTGGVRGGSGRDVMHGTLLVTGVSPRPDADGEQFVTISGVINGPTVNEHVVYQRMAVPVTAWPSMGQLMPVVYSPKNPDKWGFAPAEPLEPPQPPPPAPYT
jgi:hypothetical protein